MHKRRRILLFSGIFLLIVVAFFWVLLGKRTNPAGESVTPQPSGLTNQIEPANTEDVNQKLSILVDAISSERMFTTLENLTGIQEHSGWRGAGTAGEKEALNFIQSQLASLSWLSDNGMKMEREEFNVFLATEDHSSSLFLSDGVKTIEIPADGIRGPRDDAASIIYMDSDGSLNDNIESPVTVDGGVVLIPDEIVLNGLVGTDLHGKLLLMDYGIVDTINPLAINNVRKIMELSPAAVILVTRFSNSNGESHGTFVGDGGGVFQRITWTRSFPLLFVEMENLAPFGIFDWDTMGTLTRARVVWDLDMVNPGKSGNLILHIPGGDPAKPVLISAHIDSPNSPGALDDGSGSAILIEIATLL